MRQVKTQGRSENKLEQLWASNYLINYFKNFTPDIPTHSEAWPRPIPWTVVTGFCIADDAKANIDQRKTNENV